MGAIKIELEFEAREKRLAFISDQELKYRIKNSKGGTCLRNTPVQTHFSIGSEIGN